MNEFKEIIPKDIGLEDHFKPTEESCPKCGNRLYYGPVPCPDYKVGCLVLHQGHRCLKCGGMFTK